MQAATGRRGLARALCDAAASPRGWRQAGALFRLADDDRSRRAAAVWPSCWVAVEGHVVREYHGCTRPPSSTQHHRRQRPRAWDHDAGQSIDLASFSSPYVLPLHRDHQRRGLSTSSPTPTPPAPPTSPSSSSGIVDRIPQPLQPYLRLMRMDKPIGTWLLLWPGFWSIAMAADPGAMPDLQMLAVFGLGTVVMRSAGCTVNDLWDRDVDKHVERTRDRPITSGQISVRNGVVFLGAQLLAGLGVLLQLNEYTVLLGAASVPLVLAYPLMKRCMPYPQLVLGMTFNWGALMGWSAVHGSCAWPVVLPLYTAAVSWTVVYDTLYAHQDKRDDARLGLQSTALTFGKETKPILALFSGLTVAGLTVAGWHAGMAWPYYLGATGLTTAHLAWQLGTADLEDKENLAARFEANKWLGAAVFASAVAGRVLA